ncbi:MAG: class I tRNA ligase family protein, partial [Burkholderiaceae bacterium]|nr:class I tRNA ligase family protein [Burkholderiaceae bacterium]
YNGVGTMSKSKNNGVDPQALIDRYGADTARLFVMFASPPEQTLEWSDTGVEGAQRFLRRLWAFAHSVAALPSDADGRFDPGRLNAAQKNLRRDIHSVLKQADYDYQRLQYNTVVSAAMKMLNALEGARESVADGPAGIAVLRECLSILIRVLYPVVPHVTHGLWCGLGYAAAQGDLLDAPWPQVDAAALVQDTLELVLQINGKVRGSVSVPAGADRAAIEVAALASEPFARLSEGRAAKKVVVVPGRLVNVVV